MLKLAAYHLRPAERQDAGWLMELRSDPEVWENLGTVAVLSMERQLSWIDSLAQDERRIYLIACTENTRIGLVRLTDIDRINRSAAIGADIVRDYRGKGLSWVIYYLALRLCFDLWSLHRIWLLVMEQNRRARSLYEKLGFVYEGAQRQAICRNGKFHDSLLFSMLEDEYGSRKTEIERRARTVAERGGKKRTPNQSRTL